MNDDNVMDAEMTEQEETTGAPANPPALSTMEDEKPKGGGTVKKSFKTVLMTLVMGLLVTGAIHQAWRFWQLYRGAPVPLAYMIKSADYIGTELSKDGAVFTAKFNVEVFKENGWKKIALLPSNVAIRNASLPDDSYLLLEGGMYTVLTEEEGEMQIEISFSIAASEKDGKYSVIFKRVPSVTCVLDTTFPEEGLDVEVASSQSTEFTETNGTTRVVAALPDNTPISITWEEALPEIEKGPAKYYTETKTLISIAEGLVIGQGRIDFTILHTPTRELKMRVPDGVGVLEITGIQIRDWRVTDGILSVQLEKEVIGPYALEVKYESSPDMASGKVKVPVITGAGVVREKGDIGIVALTNVEVQNDKVAKASTIDVKDLPPDMFGMTKQPILLAYRYVEPDFSVNVDISKHMDVGVLLTIIDRANFSVMQTFDGRRIVSAVYNVRNNRNQFLRIALPKGADLWSATVAGRSVQPAKDDEDRVLLPLVRSQGRGGMSAFPVEIVYAEEGASPDDKGCGLARVELSKCSEPVMHMMVSLYVPEQGRYVDFDGTLRVVDKFSRAFGHAAPVVNVRNAAVSAQQLVAAGNMAPEHGASPMDVQLPMAGRVYLLEKILVVEDAQWFSYRFSRLKK